MAFGWRGRSSLRVKAIWVGLLTVLLAACSSGRSGAPRGNENTGGTKGMHEQTDRLLSEYVLAAITV